MNKEYDIFYRDLLIGFLEINESGKYKYIPNVENTREVLNMTHLPSAMVVGTQGCFVDPIPLLENKINVMVRAGLTEYECATDMFKISVVKN